MKRLRILALDPGSEKTGWVYVEATGIRDLRILQTSWQSPPQRVPGAKPRPPIGAGTHHNTFVLDLIESLSVAVDVLVLERFVIGPTAGNTSRDTVEWSGRFHQRFLDMSLDGEVHQYTRSRIRASLGASRGNGDAAVRRALIAEYGEPGRKSSPGRLYGVTSHAWAALAAAYCHLVEVETNRFQERRAAGVVGAQ